MKLYVIWVKALSWLCRDTPHMPLHHDRRDAMTTTTTPRTDASRQPWWARLSERCYRATTPRLVQDMQHEAAGTYGEMLEDLKTPLDAHFEREMARQLQDGQPFGFVPARTLMPVMMQRFGLQDGELAADPGYDAMRATCNGCPV